MRVAVRKTRILQVILLFFTLYQVWSFSLLFRYPIIGINVSQGTDGQWRVDYLDIESIAPEAGIGVGDTIVAINGENPGDYWSVLRWRSIDQAKTITIQKGNYSYEVHVKDYTAVSAYDLNTSLAEIVSLLVAGFTYRKIGKSLSSLFLSAVFLDMALIFVSLTASVRGDSIGKLLIGTFMMLLPAIFLCFFYVFLKERGTANIPLKLLKWYGGIEAIAFIGQMTCFTITFNSFLLFKLTINIILSIAIIGIIADFIILTYFYMKYRKENSTVASIIRTVFLALFISMSPIVFFSFVPNLLFGHEWLNSLYMSWFIFLFPLTFVYLLATHRLYDVGMIMRRLLLTVTIAAVPTLLITALLYFIYPHDASLERQSLSFLLILNLITLVLYSLENITTKLMPTMFPRKYRLQAALKKLSTSMGGISSFREMKDLILADLVETLEVTGGSIVFWYEDGPEVILEGDMQQREVEELIGSGKWTDHPDYTVFEVSRQEEYTSYLVMGRKHSGTALGIEEVQWLGLIIHYLTVSLENVHLIRKLNRKLQQMASLLPAEEDAMEMAWFRKLMFEQQEKERLRMAADLHDTTMQDLFFLKGRLRSLQDKYTYTKEDGTTLAGLMDYIDIINMNLRQSCFELHPYLLKEIGLVATLHKLIHSEQAVCPFEIELFTTEVTQIEQQTMDLKRHLFRIVQELLNNAKKHSKAGLIRISIYMHREMLCLLYEDDGVGFDSNKTAAKGEIRMSGMGLEQLKTRILSLGGYYELNTAVGKGVHFMVKLPKHSGKATPPQVV